MGRVDGWNAQVSQLFSTSTVPVTRCNSPIQSAGDFFSDMCVPGSFSSAFNLFGDNPNSACTLCNGDSQAFCTGSDPYAGSFGAIRCLWEAGDVAFVRDGAVQQFVASYLNVTSKPIGNPQLSDFQLICPSGNRADAASAVSLNCTWGSAAGNVIVTSVLRGPTIQTGLKRVLYYLQRDFGPGNQFDNGTTSLVGSAQWGSVDLMVTDATKRIIDSTPRDTYYKWITDDYVRSVLEALNYCPFPDVKWCVISDQEMAKCAQMRLAFLAKGTNVQFMLHLTLIRYYCSKSTILIFYGSSIR